MMLGKACFFFCQCSLGVFFRNKNFSRWEGLGGKKKGDLVDRTADMRDFSFPKFYFFPHPLAFFSSECKTCDT